MRRSLAVVAFGAVGLVAVACASLRTEPPPGVSDGRYVMGTVLEITLHGIPESAARSALDALFAEASRLEALFTRYEPGSALSRMNRNASGTPQTIPRELAEILRDARSGYRVSRGTFDVTVGPLVELWTRAAERDALPTPEALAEARARVGFDAVRVGLDGRVAFSREGVSVDLGGIAKGWALDRMLPLLRERGATAALLNFGQSSTWAVGSPPGEDGWRLLLRGAGDGFLGVITLADQALSVSGSLGQFATIEGRRFGHVLDPRSGQPLVRPRQAVVVAPDATRAEILSTALLVLGEAEGIALVAAQPGCEGLLVDAEGSLTATPGFREATRFEALP